jgi:hypothetical protein
MVDVETGEHSIRFEEITRVQDAYWKMRSKDAHHTKLSIRGDYTGAGCLLENAIKRCTPHNKPLTQASEKATTRG